MAAQAQNVLKIFIILLAGLILTSFLVISCQMAGFDSNKICESSGRGIYTLELDGGLPIILAIFAFGYVFSRRDLQNFTSGQKGLLRAILIIGLIAILLAAWVFISG